MPRGVTVAFTAVLQHLTHPGTSVGLGGSPLIHPLSGPQGTLSLSGHLFCADSHSALRQSSRSSTGGYPYVVPCFILYLRRGGFVNTVLPLGNLWPDMEVKNPSVCQKGIFFYPSIGEDENPSWKPDSLRSSLSATWASPDMHSVVLKSGHFSNG